MVKIVSISQYTLENSHARRLLLQRLLCMLSIPIIYSNIFLVHYFKKYKSLARTKALTQLQPAKQHCTTNIPFSYHNATQMMVWNTTRSYSTNQSIHIWDHLWHSNYMYPAPHSSWDKTSLDKRQPNVGK
jgi:hypothetical protein